MGKNDGTRSGTGEKPEEIRALLRTSAPLRQPQNRAEFLEKAGSLGLQRGPLGGARKGVGV